MLKIHQNTFGGRAPPGPAGERMRSPRPYIRNWGHTSNGDGREDTWDGTGGLGNSPPPPKLSRMNTDGLMVVYWCKLRLQQSNRQKDEIRTGMKT